MTARHLACVVIVCDGCNVDHEFDDGAANHWTSREQAATSERDADGRWEIPTDTDGPDLCPACVCARDGHEMGDPIQGNVRTIQFCQRCSHFVIDPDPEAAQP